MTQRQTPGGMHLAAAFAGTCCRADMHFHALLGAAYCSNTYVALVGLRVLGAAVVALSRAYA